MQFGANPANRWQIAGLSRSLAVVNGRNVRDLSFSFFLQSPIYRGSRKRYIITRPKKHQLEFGFSVDLRSEKWWHFIAFS